MTGLVGDRLVAIDIGLALDALGCKFVDPGEDDHRDKTERQQHEHDRQRGVIELQRIEQHVADLQKQPAQHEVRESHADHVAALEFGNKVHKVSRGQKNKRTVYRQS